jgi:hypothetical protein
MEFLKEHLNTANYDWTDEVTFTGNPTRRLYNRHNGNQLLFIINHYAASTDVFTLSNAVEIENMLMNQLPVESKSEISVLKWLKETSNLPVS